MRQIEYLCDKCNGTKVIVEQKNKFSNFLAGFLIGSAATSSLSWSLLNGLASYYLKVPFGTQTKYACKDCNDVNLENSFLP